MLKYRNEKKLYTKSDKCHLCLGKSLPFNRFLTFFWVSQSNCGDKVGSAAVQLVNKTL